MNDAIPICRSVFKHWIYDDAEFLKTWITMLGRAQFTPEPKNCLYMGISYTLHRGEFVFGRKKWCKDTGISEERLRRLITLMVKDNMISVVVFKGKFTIYKVVNYEKFNHVEKHKTKGVKPDSPPTDTPTEAPTEPQQTPQQTTTNEEGTKKVKECLLFDTPKKRTIVDEYYDLFVAKYSQKPVITGKCVKLLNDLVVQLTMEEVTGRLKMFFADTDKFVVESKHDVGVFQSRVNRYVYVEDKTDPNSEYQKKLRRDLEESRRVTW